MKKWTEKELIAEGCKIKNVEILKVNYNALELSLEVEFEVSETKVSTFVNCLIPDIDKQKGKTLPTVPFPLTEIMRIANVKSPKDLVGKYVRIAVSDTAQICEPVAIGHIISDMWYDNSFTSVDMRRIRRGGLK